MTGQDTPIAKAQTKACQRASTFATREKISKYFLLLAVVEAKKTSVDVALGQVLYSPFVGPPIN